MFLISKKEQNEVKTMRNQNWYFTGPSLFLSLFVPDNYIMIDQSQLDIVISKPHSIIRQYSIITERIRHTFDSCHFFLVAFFEHRLCLYLIYARRSNIAISTVKDTSVNLVWRIVCDANSRITHQYYSYTNHV